MRRKGPSRGETLPLLPASDREILFAPRIVDQFPCRLSVYAHARPGRNTFYAPVSSTAHSLPSLQVCAYVPLPDSPSSDYISPPLNNFPPPENVFAGLYAMTKSDRDCCTRLTILPRD